MKFMENKPSIELLKELNLSVAGPMLSGYWSGHHNPAIAVPVYKSMTLSELLESIINEYNTVYDHLEYSPLWRDISDSDLKQNIINMFISSDLNQTLFDDIEDCDNEDCESCYFFIMIDE